MPSARETMQRQVSAEMGIKHNPRWRSPHCTYGSCAYCTQVLCTHKCHGNNTGDYNAPGTTAERRVPPRPAAPVDAGEQAALFDLEAIPCP